MAHDTNKYRTFYKKLLSLYPIEFRDQLGESMEQTFNDLCRERRNTGKGMLSFMIQTFVDTLLGIIKEKIRYIKTTSKVNIITALLLLGSIIFIGVMWWINGREDTWLYATCIIIMIPSIITLFSKKKKD